MARKPRGKPLSADSIVSVRAALAKKRWTQETWAHQAHVCTSTIGRLLRGAPMDAGTLEAALTALDLEINDCISSIKQDDGFASPVDIQSSWQSDIYVTATFNKTKYPQVEIILSHLSSLLTSSSVKYFKDADGVRVLGSFEKHQHKVIEAVLQDLDAKCFTFHVTW